MSPAPQLEVLDLRHFSAAQLQPLLLEEADRWQRRLFWDYSGSTSVLLKYLDSRVLPGFVALRRGRIAGYAFAVFEAAKAVLGDVYAFGEGEVSNNPVCETLLHHLLEMLQAAPGVDRIESQLLMFPAGALAEPFAAHRFHSFPRLFMVTALTPSSQPQPQPSLPSGINLEAWQPDLYDAAAELIHRAYIGHVDSGINDQYRSIHGAQRFLHNIIRFPGCGIFDAESSWVLRNSHSSELLGIILCSRVRQDAAHITQLCINPALRGLGLGPALLCHSIAGLAAHGVTSLSLTVTESNADARRLYERHGFHTLHRFEAMVWDHSLPTP
ncbi:MAG TPA: GNAT family N-acetyltransferase [Acidobacteriaceae bacterium]|jgi:ribosomal protein S18 acetylase RimI-like enzyme|nr:GNAT family N-acetyltransferase [Acidobacteriaceae bacterium]